MNLFLGWVTSSFEKYCLKGFWKNILSFYGWVGFIDG